MNTAMYRHPACVAALKQLQDWGVKILRTDSGQLACGDVGEGRLLDPEEILKAVESEFEKLNTVKLSSNLGTLQSQIEVKASPRLKILITSGGTREPIDGVRSIANFSTGRTGAVIADHFVSQGHGVTYLKAEDAASPQALNLFDGNHSRIVSFKTFLDLQTSLQDELGRESYDAVIHMAAVSDYSIESLESNGVVYSSDNGSLDRARSGKIDSSDAVTLRLKRNPKIVDSLRKMSRNKDSAIIAFKLTNTIHGDERLQAIIKLATHATPDLIVHNDLSEIEANGQTHDSTLYAIDFDEPSSLEKIANATTKQELAYQLEDWLLAHQSDKKINTPKRMNKKVYQ
jgi:phosphopantothenoylcysteine decarboxylase/phosphopantothenate--cysteine ligase